MNQNDFDGNNGEAYEEPGKETQTANLEEKWSQLSFDDSVGRIALLEEYQSNVQFEVSQVGEGSRSIINTFYYMTPDQVSIFVNDSKNMEAIKEMFSVFGDQADLLISKLPQWKGSDKHKIIPYLIDQAISIVVDRYAIHIPRLFKLTNENVDMSRRVTEGNLTIQADRVSTLENTTDLIRGESDKINGEVVALRGEVDSLKATVTKQDAQIQQLGSALNALNNQFKALSVAPPHPSVPHLAPPPLSHQAPPPSATHTTSSTSTPAQTPINGGESLKEVILGEIDGMINFALSPYITRIEKMETSYLDLITELEKIKKVMGVLLYDQVEIGDKAFVTINLCNEWRKVLMEISTFINTLRKMEVSQSQHLQWIYGFNERLNSMAIHEKKIEQYNAQSSAAIQNAADPMRARFGGASSASQMTQSVTPGQTAALYPAHPSQQNAPPSSNPFGNVDDILSHFDALSSGAPAQPVNTQRPPAQMQHQPPPRAPAAAHRQSGFQHQAPVQSTAAPPSASVPYNSPPSVPSWAHGPGAVPTAQYPLTTTMMSVPPSGYSQVNQGQYNQQPQGQYGQQAPQTQGQFNQQMPNNQGGTAGGNEGMSVFLGGQF